MPHGRNWVRTVRSRRPWPVVVALLGMLLLATSAVFAAGLPLFTAIVTPEPGPTTRPGRTIDLPVLSAALSALFSPAPSGGLVVPVIDAVAPVRNNLASLSAFASPATGGAVSNASSTAPLVSTVARALNAVVVFNQTLAAGTSGAGSSIATPVPVAETVVRNLPGAATLTFYPIPEARSLLTATRIGGGTTRSAAAIGETRSLLVPVHQCQPAASTVQQLTEVRSFHTEADSRLPVVTRTVQPLLSSVARYVSYGAPPGAFRGGTLEISRRNASNSSQSSDHVTKTIAPLLSQTGRVSNVIEFVGSVSPVSLLTAETYPYSVGARIAAAAPISWGPISSETIPIIEQSSILSQRIQGLSLIPVSLPVPPQSGPLAGRFAPYLEPSAAVVIPGIVQPLSGVIRPLNIAPAATGDSYVVNENTTLNVAAPGLLANDSDADGDPLSTVLVSGPAHGILVLNPNGSFAYSPDPGYYGIDGFSYRASDGSLLSAPANVSITVTQVNNAPAATGDSYVVNVNTTLNVAAPGLLANDSDADGDPLSTVLVSGPAHGILVLNPNGSFAYSPDPGYHGTDGFSYRASDGSLLSAPAAVTLNVNTAPTVAGESYSVNEDGILNVVAPGLLANDSDADGDPLFANLVSGPAQGILVLNPYGSFTYVPAPDYDGPDSFSYQVGDGFVMSNTSVVDIAVNSSTDAPAAAADSYSTDEGHTLTVASPGVLSNDSDPDGDTMTSVLVTGPAHGTVILNLNGSFTYVPGAGYFGIDSFTYMSSDGTLASGPARVNIAVTAKSAREVISAISEWGTLALALALVASIGWASTRKRNGRSGRTPCQGNRPDDRDIRL